MYKQEQYLKYIADKYYESFDRQGHASAGHNGPHGHPDTPVRNTAHFVIIYMYLYKKYRDTKYLNISQKFVAYLCSKQKESKSGAIQCMYGGNFDNINVTESISILKKENGVWVKEKTGIASSDSIIELYKGVFTDITKELQVGYYRTTIGQELPELNTNGYYRCLKIDNAQNGDMFIIKGTSGVGGRLYAKIKNNIVVETSDEGAQGTGVYIVTKDDSFDTIVFNMENATEHFVLKTNKLNIPDEITFLKNNLFGFEEEYIGSLWNDGFIITNISTPVGSVPITDGTGVNYSTIELPCNEGDKFQISVRNGANARGWNFLRQDRTVITQAEASYTRLETTIIAPKDTYTLLLNTLDKTDNSYVKKVVIPIWKKENKRDLSSLKIAYLGDSAIDVGNKEWVKWCSELLGAEYKVFAVGGNTWANQFTDESKTTYKSCIKLQVDNLIRYSQENSWIPDIIVIQGGGNDLWLDDKLGSLEAAFSDFNYNTLAKDDTTYGGIRYNIQRLNTLFPNAQVIVGTVFQRRGNDASKIAIPIREVCAKLGVALIDGNKYSGINAYEELTNPVYSDNPNATNTGTREYPQYNWVEPDGIVVSVDSKTESAVKKYGKYTYDGIHKTLVGERHIAVFMASQISAYVGFNNKKIVE